MIPHSKELIYPIKVDGHTGVTLDIGLKETGCRANVLAVGCNISFLNKDFSSLLLKIKKE